MDKQDIRELLRHLEKIADTNERIAVALEKANDSDPLQAIERALAGEQASSRHGGSEADVPPGVPTGEEWRFR